MIGLSTTGRDTGQLKHPQICSLAASISALSQRHSAANLGRQGADVQVAPRAAFAAMAPRLSGRPLGGLSCVNVNSALETVGARVYVMFTQQLRPVLIVLS